VILFIFLFCINSHFVEALQLAICYFQSGMKCNQLKRQTIISIHARIGRNNSSYQFIDTNHESLSREFPEFGSFPMSQLQLFPLLHRL